MFLHSTDILSQPVRIISLVPSITELLSDLGLENETIAITKFCVHPSAWFQVKHRIGGTKTVDIDKVVSLYPDLIIANKEENVKEQVELLANQFPVWLTDVNDVAEAFQMIKDIGKLTFKSSFAEALVSSIQWEFSMLPVQPSPVPVAYLIWKDPYMTIGGDTFINDMLNQAGMKNVFSEKTRYPEIKISDIAGSGCKLLLLSSEPYPFAAKHIGELENLLPGITIKLADGEMFSWYGSRMLRSAAYFRSQFYLPFTD